MGREEEEQAKRAAELKAKIAQRNKERKERQEAGGAPAMALEAEKKATKSKVAKKPAKPKKAAAPKKQRAESEKVKVAKKAPAKIRKQMAKAPKNGSTPRRIMDRDKSTGLRPIETQIIKICRRTKKPLDVRTIADKLFGSDKVVEASGEKDNKRLREVRNAIRVPIQKEILHKAGSGLVVHKDFADQVFDPVSVGLAAHSKAKKVARKATGKRT